MTGGMTPPTRGGVPLKDRPVAGAPHAATGHSQRARHCWVESATGDEVAHPGLVIEWRRAGEGWSALVTYVVEEGANAVVVTQWLDGALLRPAP